MIPGAISEDRVLSELLDNQPVQIKEVCADSQYGTAEHGEVPAVYVRLNPFAAQIQNTEA